MITLFIIIQALLLLALIYSVYQTYRNYAVYNIIIKWINDSDNRYHLYTYEYMMEANKHNWYGLTFPKESQYEH